MPRKPSKVTEARNAKMVKNIMKGMTQGEAYADSREREYRGRNDSNIASRQLSKPEVQAMMEKMKNRFVKDAEKAYNKGWEVAEDEATPPHVKIGWFDKVLDRAVPAQPNVNLHQHVHQFPEFMKSKAEIIEMMDEPETAQEISKRNRHE